MKKTKKLTSILCTAALLASMCTYASADASAAETEVTTFTFTDSGVTVSDGADEAAYSIKGTALTIKESGSYKVTGACDDGSIKVKKGTQGVTLTLSDLSLKSSATAPLACNKNTQADIIVEGTVSLEDSINNSEDYLVNVLKYDEASDEVDNAENAVVKLKGGSKVNVSGSGTLNVTAHAKNGIKSGATLDSDMDTEIAPNSESEYYSYLTMRDLTVNIDTTDVYNPDSTVKTGFGQEVETVGDAINAKSTLELVSGKYTINAGDDAFHSDYFIDIGSKGAQDSKLNIDIQSCYEGIEAPTLNFNSGKVNINATDDAINAANGDLSKLISAKTTSANSYLEAAGNQPFVLNINGGEIYAYGSSDDAVDSNGMININGGTLIALASRMGNVFDTGTDGNNTIDSTFNIYGGTVLGLGQSDMPASVSSASAQSWAIWSGNGGGNQNPGFPGMNDSDTNRPTPPGMNDSDTNRPTPPGMNDSDRPTPPGMNDSDMTPPDLPEGMDTDMTPPVPPVEPTMDTESQTPPSGAPGGRDSAGIISGTSGNITDTSVITLTSGDTTGIAVGSAPNVTNGNKVAVMLKSDTELISTTAKSDAGYVLFAGSLGEYTDSTKEAPKDSDNKEAAEKQYDNDTDVKKDSEPEVKDSDANAEGFKGTFVINGGKASVTAYATHDYTSGEENVASAYAREDENGKIVTDGTGQINFTVKPEDGYKVAKVEVKGEYKNLKNISETDETVPANTYRVTKIESDVTIDITLEKEGAKADTDTENKATNDNAEGFKGTFVINGGNASVTTYATHDYTSGEENVTSAYAREDINGKVVTDGTGQINFTVKPEDGYKVAKVEVKGEYKNLKNISESDDTVPANTYRVTKIGSDVTIEITLEKKGDEPNIGTDTDGTSTDVDYIKGTFVINGGKASVTTYDTHDYTKGTKNATQAFARDDTNGEAVTDGTGQINFTVIPESGYKVAKVEVTNGTYKNLKNISESDDTVPADTYRITKIESDITIEITLEKVGDKTDTDTDVKDTDTDQIVYNVLYGDTTLDGEIMSDDALLALRCSVGLEEALTGAPKYAADVNFDGMIDSSDALSILRFSVGIKDEGSLVGQKSEVKA